ncbi:hypothetical protein Tco_0413188 [Tanacetum coccineum]
MLELRDLPHKISQTVNEVFKEAVQIALQAPLRKLFRDLSKAEMKEILHQQMFESGSYQLQPEHVALYKALEASMDRDNKGEFFKATTKSRKRHRDDQDPPPPPPDLDQGKKKKHDSEASAAHQPQPQMSLTWKTTDTRDAPSSSSKQKTASQSEQPIEDIPIPDDHVPEEERPETPEPDWAVPLNDLREPENNLANAIAKSYKDPKENKLLRRIGDIGSFIKWYCRQIGKLKLGKADLEGPANKIDLVNPEGNQIVHDVSKPLPLGGPPDQIESEREYDVSEAYGISHWWFKRKEFYITRHNAHSDCRAVRSHMKIRSVISESDFKNLHPNDFEDMNIIIRKCVEDLQLGIESYQTKLNLKEPSWDAIDFLFKEDSTIVSKPRVVIYRDRNN